MSNQESSAIITGSLGELRALIGQTSGLSPERLIELAQQDQQRHWRLGQRVPVEAYLEAFPALRGSEETLDLILGECLLRQEIGERPTLEEFLYRFPRHAEQIRLQFDLDQVCEMGAGQITPTLPPRARATLRLAGSPTIPGYDVLGELGRGGMGVVYKANQVALDRIVALKTLLAGEFARPEELARFRAEAEAAARLQHPNVIQIHDVGEHEGRLYISMEYLDGGSLAERLDGTPWPAEPAARLVETVALAVHALHQKGIIHRDLKPGNVLLAADGNPKVADFGLAKQTEREASLTGSGYVVGTPCYVAPEQGRGERGLTAAADLWALGAVLYELLTGRPPFKAATPLETLLQVQQADPLSLRALNPAVPRDLETVCLKCLEKLPSRRYGSAEELAQELRRFLAGEPVSARPVGPLGRAWRWCRRNKAVAALLAAVWLTLVGGAAASLALAGWATSEKHEAEEAKQKAETNEGKVLRQQDTAEAMLYVSDMRLAQQALQQKNTSRLRELLDRHDPDRTGRRDRRGWEWFYLRRIADAQPRTFGGPCSLLAATQDGRRVAVSRGKSVEVRDVATGKSLMQSPELGTVYSLAISPDGRLVGAVVPRCGKAVNQRLHRGDLVVMDVQTGKEVASIPQDCELSFGPPDVIQTIGRYPLGGGKVSDAEPHAHVICFSHDGRRLLRTGANWDTLIWDLPAGKEVVRLKIPARYFTAVAFAPNGLVALGDSKGALVFNPTQDVDKGGKLIGKGWRGLEGGGSPLAFGPKGRLIAGGDGNRVAVWEAATGRRLFTTQDLQAAVRCVAFRDGGRRVVAVTQTCAREWAVGSGAESRGSWAPFGDLVALLPAVPQVLSGDPSGLKVWELNPPVDGIVFGTTAANSVPAPYGYPFSAPPSHPIRYGSPVAFRPDGKVVAVVRANREHNPVIARGQLVDAESGEPLATLDASSSLTTVPTFSPDGRVIAAGWENGTVRAFGPDGKKVLFTVQGPRASCRAIRFSPDSRRLAAAWQDGQVWAIDSTTGQHVRVRGEGGRGVNWIGFRPGGELLLCEDQAREADAWSKGHAPRDLQITALDLKGGERTVVDLARVEARCVVFSPDLRKAAALSGKRGVSVWDLQTGELEHFRGEGVPHSAPAFSRDGERLAVGFETGQVLVWDLARPDPLLTLRGHQKPLVGVSFSPDGRRLVSASADGVVKFWDVKSGQEVLTLDAGDLNQKVSRVTLRGRIAPSAAIEFSPDGRRLLVGDEVVGGRLWSSLPCVATR